MEQSEDKNTDLEHSTCGIKDKYLGFSKGNPHSDVLFDPQWTSRMVTRKTARYRNKEKSIPKCFSLVH